MFITCRVKNDIEGTASVTLAYQSASDVLLAECPPLSHNELSDPITIDFDPDAPDVVGKWFASVVVSDGSNPGIYESRGSPVAPGVRRRLQKKDNEGSVVMSVRLDEATIGRFSFDFTTGEFTGTLDKTGPYTEKIRHVFVLMLENRPFDQLLGWSGLTGPDAEGTVEHSAINGVPRNADNHFHNNPDNPNDVLVVKAIQKSAGDMRLSVDPGHEFPDVLEQLSGANAVLNADGEYPPMSGGGFADSYAKVLRQKGKPPDDLVEEVMSGVGPDPPLALLQLARSYAVCDNWFCSLPGPTWPNRFFAVAGTSGGLDVSPTTGQLVAAEYLSGFTLDKGTVFSALRSKGCSYRIYKDYNNRFAEQPSGTTGLGWQTITAGIKGISRREVRVLDHFDEDLRQGYPYQFTFIEPHYGNSANGTYQGGSSQHPMDGLLGGERLIAFIYQAIRNSPLWEHSMLIITYDETGGQYDHVLPPPTVAPDQQRRYNRAGFNFKRLGPRVPAVVVSPWITPSTIDHAQYDHTSMIATVMKLFADGEYLTERDKHANNLLGLLREPVPRDEDCPSSVVVPDMLAKKRDEPATNTSWPRDSDGLPDEGNIIGFLELAAKVDLELSDGSDAAEAAILERLKTIQSYGNAKAYILEVFDRLNSDTSDGDEIDDVLRGEASDDEQAKVASTLGLRVEDMNAIRVQTMATSLMRRLQSDSNSPAVRQQLLEQIEEFEDVGLELGDADDNGFYVPHGTSALLRAWFTKPPADHMLVTPRLGIQFVQEGQIVPIMPEGEHGVRVKLRREPFVMKLPEQSWPKPAAVYPALQITVSDNPALLANASFDKPADQTAFFWPGTGMADYEHGSNALGAIRSIDDKPYSHNYIVGPRFNIREPEWRGLNISSIMINLLPQNEDMILTSKNIYMVCYMSVGDEKAVESSKSMYLDWQQIDLVTLEF